MSEIRLKIRDGCREPYVEFHVDGEDLGARLRKAFGGKSSDDVLPWHGIDYSITETVLGEDVMEKGTELAILFACGCGCYACSGVSVRVRAEGETIAWSEFATWDRDGRVVAETGPIIFDRRQFAEAVRGLKDGMATWSPSTTQAKLARPTLIVPDRRDKS